MGTNYYWYEREPKTCECGHVDEAERLHIGKSSVGWTFSFQVYPERGINSGADWIAKFSAGGRIENEYGEGISPAWLIDLIKAKAADPNSLNHAREYGSDPLYRQERTRCFVDADGHSCSTGEFS